MSQKINLSKSIQEPIVISEAVGGIRMNINNRLMDRRRVTAGTSLAISTISALRAMSVNADSQERRRGGKYVHRDRRSQ
ncbi:MAG: hypothetical protein EBU26_14080 [Verrucomicrobia bacterium]|nr:hypothetical protein [Verrucomicrobiota bacterium]